MSTNIMEDKFDKTLAGFPTKEQRQALNQTRMGLGTEPPSFSEFDYDDMPSYDEEKLVRFKPVQDAVVRLKKGNGCYFFEIRSKKTGQCLIRLGLTAEQTADMFTGGKAQAIAQFFGPEGEE